MKSTILIVAFLLIATGLSAEAQDVTKGNLDDQFRKAAVTFYESPGFATMDVQQVIEKIAEMGRTVYGPHAAILAEIAAESFRDIPKASEDQIVRVESPLVLPISDLMKSEKDSGRSFEGYLSSGKGSIAYLNNLDLRSAGRMAIQMAVAQSSRADVIGKRSILSGYVKDRVYRLNDDPVHPLIAIDSLGEWFVVAFDWMEQGFYFPARIEWHKKGEQGGAGQPPTRLESK